MANISIPEIQAWLEATKLTVSGIDTELESAVAVQTFSLLSVSYDTSGWTTAANTPVLVRKILAMLYAAWFYRRQYSEEDLTADPNNYPAWLEKRANMLLEGVINGNVDLLDVPGTVDTISGPDFYPTDSTGITDPHQAAKFTMGAIF